MAGLSSSGIGSGIDVNSLVSKLMDAERVPVTQLDNKEASYQAKLTAYGTLKGSLSSFQTAAQGLTTVATFNANSATSTDNSVFTATANSVAKAGSYSVEVNNLAQAQKLTSTGFTDTISTVGTGTLTIDFGTVQAGPPKDFTLNPDKKSTSISINSSNNSLAGIRDAINAANAGVTASIVNDGSNYRLVLTGQDSGAKNSMRITVSGDGDGNSTDNSGLSRLAFDPTAAAGSGKNIEEKIAAQDAQLTVDGIAITKSSNTISDAIPGVTLNLLKKSDGTNPVGLSVSRDSSSAKSAVQAFVKGYNDLASTVKSLGSYDATTQKGGILLGDSALRGIQSKMRQLLSQSLGSNVSPATLSEIGVSFQRDGTLAIDSTKLDKALADPSKNVAALFATYGTPSDSLVSYAGSSDATTVGSYSLNITQIATRGQATGSRVLGGSTTIDGSHNTLTLSLNGQTSTITLKTGAYTPDELAAELQSQINGNSVFQSAQGKVTVSQSGGMLTVMSARYGSASKVDITGGTALSTLFNTVTSTVGKDVAGQIGGVAATGSGQMLTGAGSASGLQLLISGGSTGDRGTVGFTRGVAYQVNQALQQMIQSGGSIAGQTDGIQQTIKDIGKQRDALNLRLTKIEERYRAQFNAMDTLVASMQQTSNYLTQQLASLSSSSK